MNADNLPLAGDEETVSLPLSQEDAATLTTILGFWLEDNQKIEIPKDHPEYEKLMAVQEMLLERVPVILGELREINIYFLNQDKVEEKTGIKLISKPKWD